MMRRILTVIMALAIVAALALPALADVDIRYVNKDELKVYEEQDEESKVLKKLKGGEKLLIETESEEKDWCSILIENPAGGQMLGWVQAEHLAKEMPQKYCAHEWSDFEILDQPTCSHPGGRRHYCTVCGYVETQEIAQLPHEYGDWQVTQKATCSKPGERVRTCSVCGHQAREEVTVPHTYNDWTITKNATCSETGSKTRTCQVCGHQDTRSINKLPHEYAWVVTVPMTDHSSGVRHQVCAVCGHAEADQSFDPEGTMRRKDRGEDVYYMQQLLVDQGYLNVGGADGIFGGGTEKAVMQFQKDQGLQPDGVVWPQTLQRMKHDFGPWETTKPMTRSEAGERTRTCKDCGYQQTESVEAGTTFEFNRRGEDIRALQQILSLQGFDAGKFDGIYGKKLDAAFTGFAQANGLTFEEGHVRPCDVDALVNAWFASVPAEEWMGEGTVDSTVNMALTVTPGTDENADPDITTYGFSLTNLGSEKCQFVAILLTYGDEPDFTHDNLVMVIDGFELKGNCDNSFSGSFAVASTWGQGNLNFAAMAMTESDGAKWLSNTVTFENAAAGGQKTVAPNPVSIDLNNLADGIYPVSFLPGDVFSGASGLFINAAHIYSMDTYDIVDVATLAEGDTLVVNGQSYAVESVERDEGFVLVNGGYDAENGWTLAASEEDNVYRIAMYDDYATYTDFGATTLTLSEDAVFMDASNLEADPVTYAYGDIAGALQAAALDFLPENACVRVEDGKVAEIRLDFMP